MLACFSALNESSNLVTSGDSSEESEEIPEYQDEDFLQLYNAALTKYGCEDFIEAERKFRNLLESDYFRQCGWECPKPRPIATKLQYNSFRYLGLCLAKRSSFEECLDCLQNAINIDNTDRTLFFKFAFYATKAGRLHQARAALEASMILNQPPGGRPTFPHVQHWPTLDLLISLTYKLGDFISTLRYIDLALLDDQKYEKGLRVRTKIYEECPYLNPDPSKHNDPIIMHSVIVTLPRKPVQIIATPLQITSLSIKALGECLVQEYTKCGVSELLLNPCTISVVEKPVVETPTQMSVDKNDVVIVDTKDDDTFDKMDVEVVKEKDDSGPEIVQSILDDLVLDITRPPFEDFIASIITDMICDVVMSSVENPTFYPAPRRRGAASTFMNEVPLDLLEIRRSSRGKGGTDDKGEEVTAKSLLESYLPQSLKLSDEKIKADKKRQLLESGSPVKKNAESEENCPSLVSPAEENVLVQELLESVFSGDFILLDGMSDMLLSISEKFSNKKWPISMSDMFLRCYLIWRRHYVLPEDEDHPYLGIIILANEIVLGEAYSKPNQPLTVVAENAANVDYDEEEDEEEKMTEFVEADIEHLKFKLFSVSRSLAVRIFSLNIQFYKWQDMTSEALSIGENMKDFLSKFCIDEPGQAFCPIETYVLVSRDNLDSFLDSLRTNSMISKVSALYEDKHYDTVQHILSSYLTKKKRKGAHCGAANSLRSYHICMMIECVWNLEDYSGALSWSEVAVHEALEDLDKKKSDESEELVINEESAKEVFDLFKMIECCAAMLDGQFKGLDGLGRSRLAKNLLSLVLQQVEGSEEAASLGMKTVLPWILLHKLIVYEESKSENEVVPNSIPGSLELLCSAHDYLGPLGLCTVESGHILRLLVDKISECLPKVQGQKVLVDHLTKHMDQALYCLYAHPSKKSKLKHLVDHGVSNVAFTWEQCMSPYQFLKPETLPEFDDFKSNSISAETMTFFRRIVAVVPDWFDMAAREAHIIKYLKSDSETFPRYPKPASSAEEFPRQLRDLFYLLADHFFKNNEFPTALKYYRIDLSLNAQRVDSWFAMALSLGSGLEPKINETKKDSNNAIVRISSDLVKQILFDAEEVTRCFKICLKLTPKNSTIQIESANFAYIMFSFCSRRESDCENMSMELFTRIEKLKNYFLNFALDHYNEALKQMEGQDSSTMSSDERWLLFLMKGKITLKKKKPVEESLTEYMKAVDNLISQGACPLPKRISFNSPPEMSLELLEVYYRIHATILKQEFGDEFPPTKERLLFFADFLEKVDRLNLFTLDLKTGKDDRSQSSETDTMFEPPPAKMSKVDENISDDAHSMWDVISRKCLKGLETVIGRFPEHFKALHMLSHYFLKSEKNKDLKKVQRYLWGSEPNTGPGAASSGGSAGQGGMGKVNALFGERKSNNLFNGIWRFPNSEFDRAGNFSTHMGKCTTALLEMASQLKDAQILYDVAWQLRKPADGDRKYLFERERVNLEKQALTLMRRILRANADQLLNTEPEKEDGAIGEDKVMEARGVFLMEAYQYYFKVKRWWHTKDEAIVCILIDIYAKIVGKGNVTFDEVSSFCQRMQIMEKSASSSGGKKTSAECPSTPTASMIRTARDASLASHCPKSNSNSNAAASTSGAQSANASNAAAAAAAAAMMSNCLASTTSYYTEMAKMLGADPTTAAAYSAEAAYLEMATRYPEILNQGAVSISPIPGTSGGASKPGGVQRKNLTNKQSSLLGIKKTSTGTVSKPVHRKSLDPKLIAGSTGKSPYFGSTKSQSKDGSKVGGMTSYGSVPNLSQTQLFRKQQLQKQRAAAASGLSPASAATSGILAGTVSITPSSGGASKYSPGTVKQMKQQQRLMKLGVNPKLTVTTANSTQQGSQQARPQPSQQPKVQNAQQPRPQPAHQPRTQAQPQSRPQMSQQPKPQPAHQIRPQMAQQQPRPQPAHQQSQKPQSLLKPQAAPPGIIRPKTSNEDGRPKFSQSAPKMLTKPRPKPPPPSSANNYDDDDVICID